LNALEQGKVGHAYLFCGPRGTGKTSAARLLAKAVNCLPGGQGEPCNTCTMCQAIAEGRSFDLIEIDAASNTGVDDIRDLREKVNYAPTEARYKVYIVDEVHMLSNSAFNALLKTLEEPPPRTIFVLATTEVHRVPATVTSRCQRFDFRRIPLPAMRQRLEHICREEAVTVEPGALELLARVAEGSLRDAENLLEQILISSAGSVTAEDAREFLGMTGDARVHLLARALLQGDLPQALGTLEEMAGDGVDLRRIHRELLDMLRGLLLLMVGGNAPEGASQETLNELRQTVGGGGVGRLSRLLRQFSQVDLRSDALGALPLELAIVDATSEPERQPVAAAPSEPVGSRPSPRPVQAAPFPRRFPPPPAAAPARADATGPVIARPAVDTAPPDGLDDPVSGEPLEVLRARWTKVLEALHRPNPRLEAVLRTCEAVEVADGMVVIGVPSPFHQGEVESAANRSSVEQIISQVLGSPHQVRCTIVERRAKTSNHLVRAALDMGARIVPFQPRDQG
ncbi:MAG: DNA polymerase III subunit gamma/tau, partial [Chloroflexi bacterium]|nr:DNA polymerase III subunit gamma/tau [Chloroflexota bacterium]